MAEKYLTIEDADVVQTLFGNYDENIRLIQNEYDVVIVSRNDEFKICGSENSIKHAKKALESLISMIKDGNDISDQAVRYIASAVSDGEEDSLSELHESGVICLTASGKAIRPRTAGQKR